MSQLYNPEIKERYLSTFDSDGTRNVIRHLFYKSYSTEYLLEKDLCNFNLNEIEKVIRNINPHDYRVAKTNGSRIYNYIKWAIEEGYRTNKLNPMKGIDNSFYEELIDKSKKIHYSFDEFIELLEQLPNAQDQALLVLFWEGLDIEEIRFIRYEDINWNKNEIKIMKRGGEILEVNDKFMRYIENAYKSSEYKTYKEDGRYTENVLLPSDYLFKNTKSPRTKENTPVSYNTIYNRLINIKTEFNLDYLTQNSLKQSAQMYMIVEMYKKEGELKYKHWAKIGEKYNTPKIKISKLEYYNTSYFKAYITKEKLKELYDIEVHI